MILSRWTALDTMNQAAYKWKAIGVGSFDVESLVVSSGSGRTSGKNISNLDCVAKGRVYLGGDEKDSGQILEGTSVAASRVVGAIAALYSKWEMEKGSDFPNTQMMRRWLGYQLRQVTDQQYPHINQGNGILDIEKLQSTLIVPLE